MRVRRVEMGRRKSRIVIRRELGDVADCYRSIALIAWSNMWWFGTTKQTISTNSGHCGKECYLMLFQQGDLHSSPNNSKQGKDGRSKLMTSDWLVLCLANHVSSFDSRINRKAGKKSTTPDRDPPRLRPASPKTQTPSHNTFITPPSFEYCKFTLWAHLLYNSQHSYLHSRNHDYLPP